jgi:hypothetical protein
LKPKDKKYLNKKESSGKTVSKEYRKITPTYQSFGKATLTQSHRKSEIKLKKN